MIEYYEFGKIIIDGKIYTSDIIICKDKILQNWWRKEGHNLCLDDIKDVIEKNKPKFLIIGCGANSVMSVLEEVKTYCIQNKIELYINNTYDAVNLYNRFVKENKHIECIFCVHLTC